MAKLTVSIIITLVSRVMMAAFGLSGVIAFLNPCNWIGFFSIGIIVRQLFLEKPHGNKLMPVILLIGGMIGVLVFALIDTRMSEIYTYWSYCSCILQISWIAIIGGLSYTIKNWYGRDMGKNSLPIYLTHIIFIGYITGRVSVNYFGVVIISVLVISILYLVFYVGAKISNKLRIGKIYNCLTGFKYE